MVGAAKPLRTALKTTAASSALPSIEPGDRRKHALVYNYWLSLKGARPYPSIWDLDPFEIADAGPNSVMLDLSKDLENPEVFVGEALRSESNPGGDTGKQLDARSLLSCILNNYRAVLGKSGPIAFEDKCAVDGDKAIYCFGTLFPFTSTGSSIDYIFGLISWKEVAEEAASAGAAPDVAVANDTAPQGSGSHMAPANDALPDDALSGEPEADGAVFGQAASDDVAFGDIVSRETEADAAAPDDAAYEDIGKVAQDDRLPVEIASDADVTPPEAMPVRASADDPLPVELASDADPTPADAISIQAHADDPLPVEVASDFDLAPAEAMPVEAAADDPLLAQAAPEAEVTPADAVLGQASTDEALPEPSPEHDQSIDPVLGEPVPDDVVSDGRIFEGPLFDDAASRITAIGKAFFGAVRTFVVSDHAVSYQSTQSSTPRILSVGNLFAEAASRDPAHAAADPEQALPDETTSVAPEDALPDDVAAMPAEDVFDAPIPGEADPDGDALGENMAGDAAPDDTLLDDEVSAAPLPPVAETDDPVPDDAVPDVQPASGLIGAAASPPPAVFVELAPLDAGSANEEPADIEPVGVGSETAAPPPAVFVDLAPLDAAFGDEEQEEAASEAAAFDDSMADDAVPDPAVPADRLFTDLVSLDTLFADAEQENAMPDDAVPVPQPQPEVAETQDQDAVAVTPVAHQLAEPVAKPAGPVAPKPDHGLCGQLSIAQAIAASAQDAGYQSRAILYVALGHAYDFALAAEADPDAYGKILDDAGLELQVQAPMTPIVQLVFGAGYDGARLNDFAAALAWARHAHVPAGSLASHLEFLEAGLAIVAPVRNG